MNESVSRYARGVMGETAAAAYLESHGMKVLFRRYKAGRGEIDLISLAENRVLSFAEVKTRENGTTEEALFAVTPAKQRRMMDAALWFLSAHPEYEGFTLRFDVVTITKEGIQFFPNAFEA